MSDRVSTTLSRLHRLVSLYVEFGILLFCAVIVSGTGRAQGPVFDAVGPDFFPAALALIVGLLTMVQIAMTLAKPMDDSSEPRQPNWPMLRNAAIFVAATAIYVLLLAQRVAPLYLATCAFMACTTALLTERPGWRDVVLGAAIGLGLGIVLQYVFTQILVIDLPA